MRFSKSFVMLLLLLAVAALSSPSVLSQTVTSSTLVLNPSSSSTTLNTTASTMANSTTSSPAATTQTVTANSTSILSTSSTFSVSQPTNSTTLTSTSTSSSLEANFTTSTSLGTTISSTTKTTSTTALTTTESFANPPSTVLVTVDSSPSGSSAVSVDGSMIATPHTFNWTIGSSHLLAANSSFSCGSGCQWAYTGWSDGGNQAHLVTASDATALYTASFHLQYYLTTTASPSKGGTLTPASGWVNDGNAVKLHAFSASSFHFSSWSCSGVNCYNGTSPSPTITVTSPVLEIAGFQRTPSGYSVTFQQDGLPPGVVWSILVDGNYYITGSSSLTVTGLSGTVDYAYQGIVFGNYLYNQYYYTNCYDYNQYCYNNWNYYNQYFRNYYNQNPYANDQYYLSEFVCVYNCQDTVSRGGSTTSGYVFYQTINQNLSPPEQQPTYSMTFQEYGLPPGTPWSITVGGNYFTTSDPSITVYGLSGTINYAYQNLASSFYCQSNCSGSIPYGGSVTATYQTTPPSAVPEFNSLGPLTLIIAFILVLILRPRRGRN